MPIAVPDRRCDVWTMDAVMPLPVTKQGNSAIWVFVEKLSKLVHMVATKHTITAPELATVFMREVVRHHGVPKSIISDRGSVFTSNFWRALWSKLGTRLSMSTAYHPQSDGQTERMNRTMEDMLRAYVNSHGSDWDEHLVAAEIAINNSVQASSGFTPYFLTYGQHPRMPIESATGGGVTVVERGYDHDDGDSGMVTGDQGNSGEADGDEDTGDGDCNPAASGMVRRISEAVARAKVNLAEAQQRQAKYADEKRRERVFKVGDQVLLSTANLSTHERAVKLLPKWIGPYKIKRVVNQVAYELSLPVSMKMHPVFHVSKLRAYVDGAAAFPSRDTVVRPEPELLDGVDEAWEVQEVLNKRVRTVKRRKVTQYLVLWKGYPLHEATWEDASHLSEAQWSVDQYERRVSGGVRVRPPRRR